MFMFRSEGYSYNVFFFKKSRIPCYTPVHFTPEHKHDTVLDKSNQHVTKVPDCGTFVVCGDLLVRVWD